MSDSLPLRANLDWLKKTCKERLAALRATDPQAKLSEAQLAVARDYGFPSWRKLKAHVEQVRDALGALDSVVPDKVGHAAAAAAIAPDDPDLAQLLSAVEAGDLPTITQLLGRRPALAAAHGPEGQTPLHIAAQCNDPRLGVFLMSCGADPEATFGQSGHTVLSWAVTCNAMEFAKALVKLGAKPDLFCAAGIGSLDHVRAFFDSSGQLLPHASRTGSSRFAADGTRLPCPPPTAVEQVSDALYIACRVGQSDVVRYLLARQPDLTFRAYLGGKPLHWAHFGGSREVIEMLEQAGADPAARDNALGCTPRAFGICVPAQWGFEWLVRQRLSADLALANFMDGQTSPLHEAARGGSAAVVQLLLEAQADPALRDGDGKTPLDIAVHKGNAQAADLLRAAVRQ